MDNIPNHQKDSENNNDNYTKYIKMSYEERYEFCVQQYFLQLNSKELFRKNLHMRYILNKKIHNFFYDYEQDKFFLNSNEQDTVNKINNLNEMIMYIRVYNMDERSINWIHPLYCENIQYLEDDSKEWKSLSIFNK